MIERSFPDNAWTQGHAYVDGKTYFLFDAGLYGVSPERVIVTGAFRGWDADLEDPQWQLHRVEDHPGRWVLTVENHASRTIGASCPFKFRVDHGRWLDPPRGAKNVAASNLLHRPGAIAPRLWAEMQPGGTVWCRVAGEVCEDCPVMRPLDPAGYRLTDAAGHRVPLDAVVPLTATEAMLIPNKRLDRRRVHFLDLPGLNLRVPVRFDGWFRHLVSTKPLGANVSADRSQTTFGLFAPRAEAVRLYLYTSAEQFQPDRTFDLTRDEDCVWEVTVPGDLHGVYYDFSIHGPVGADQVPEPGNYFYETHPVHVSDPYARVSVDSFGKCRVWRATSPASPLRYGRPSMADVMAYEVHVEDFTLELPIDESLRGTIPGMTVRGLTNDHGQPIGMDHLLRLGINVVHLMPVQEYLHYPSDVWQKTFGDDPYMIAGGVDQTNYQWGYRTTHAFAIETRYRRRGSDHGDQREQFRDLVQAFHDHDIAVIIDLVPNHTGENMDGQHHLFNFNAIDLPYYYRTDNDLGHIGPFGNEVKTEDRPMVQRWLIDQCRHFIDEFGIDGFRIDLAGQIDKQSLLRLRQELGPDIIIYGEPWIAPSDPDVASNPDWGWYKSDAPITYFQDSARNALKGSINNPTNKANDRGYAGGNASLREDAMLAISNAFDDEIDPDRGINYLDIHDNWTLADQFASRDWDGRWGVDEKPYKIAATMLLTSLGPVVLHGGTEFMRTKGRAPLGEVIKRLPDGPLYFHGKSDTYNLRTPNLFVWSNVGGRPSGGGQVDGFVSPHDYAGMLDYWRGLLKLRGSDLGRVFRVGRHPESGYLRFFLPSDRRLMGYMVGGKVLVLINTSEHDATFHHVELPHGNWRLIADGNKIDAQLGINGQDWTLDGVRAHDLRVPPETAMIWAVMPR